MATPEADEVYRVLNDVAQGRMPSQEAVGWFAHLSTGAQSAVLVKATHAIGQAHPVASDAGTAIVLSGLRPTYTPCVLLRGHPMPEALARIRSLPTDEWGKAFQLFVALFTIADERRRETKCKGGCSHPWHNQDVPVDHATNVARRPTRG